MTIGRRAVIGAAAGAIGYVSATGVTMASPKAVVGQPAPKFTVYLYGGGQVTSEELAGKVVILNYWATWCAPCRTEMPMMDAYLRQNPRAAADLKIFAVGAENSPDAAKLQPLAKALSYPLVTGIKGWGYGVRGGVPTNFVIDRAGIVRHAEAGAFSYASLDEMVAPLLDEAAPA
jgi:cytochrome c biogenesis protein CcmG/thiol:disulfide interchange protein DsbE